MSSKAPDEAPAGALNRHDIGKLTLAACFITDLRDPQRILGLAEGLLDFSRPVAVLLLAILQHVEDEDDPHRIVTTLMNAVPPGSYLALSHPAKDLDAQGMAKMAQTLNEVMAEKIVARDRATVARFFDGLEPVEPGLVRVSDWRPPTGSPTWGPAALWAGVGRKP